MNEKCLESEIAAEEHICVEAVAHHARSRRVACLGDGAAELCARLPAARIAVPPTPELNEAHLAAATHRRGSESKCEQDSRTKWNGWNGTK